MKKNNTVLDHEETIDLLNVYLNEWMHRDTTLWKQIFQFFYANLIIILIPNITLFDVSVINVPVELFYVLGFMLSIVFLYISLAYSIRLRAVSKKYQEIIDMLPKDYRRYKVKDLNKFGCVFNLNLSTFISIVMFLLLMSSSLIMLFFT